MTNKIVLRIRLDKNIYKMVWDKAYKQAINNESSPKGLFSKIIIEAIEYAITNDIEIDENREYPETIQTSVTIPKELRMKLLEKILEKYGSKYGMLTHVINQSIEKYLSTTS